MKRSFFIVIGLLFVCVLAGVAQQQMTPQANSLYYQHRLESKNAYANSDADTSAAVNIGGASWITYVFQALDSCAVDIYVDAKLKSDTVTTSWAAVLTDSCINTTNTGKKQEYLLRTSTANVVLGLEYQLRVRRAFRASANGVSSAYYKDGFRYKP